VGDTAIVILVGYAILAALGSLAALAVFVSTRGRRAVDVERLTHRETTWLWIVLVLLLALLLATIVFVPYGAEAKDGRQVVRVTARQFAFDIRPARIEAAVPAEFRLTAPDVNHGFGVYDEDDVLIFQVQVMPGKTQKVVHTFDRPGRYHVLCLEFCGVGHHAMTGSFDVEAPR
jgi:cytochrome c oxidase subunit 2